MEPLIKVKHSKKKTITPWLHNLPKGTRTITDLNATDLAWLNHTQIPARKTANTTNPHLHQLIQELQTNTEELIHYCQQLWKDTSKEEYLSLLISDTSNQTPTEAAATTYYLNQHAKPGTKTYNKPTTLNTEHLTYWAEKLANLKTTQENHTTLLENQNKTTLAILDLDSINNPEEILALAIEENKKLLAISNTLYEKYPHQTTGITRPGLKTEDYIYSIT